MPLLPQATCTGRKGDGAGWGGCGFGLWEEDRGSSWTFDSLRQQVAGSLRPRQGMKSRWGALCPVTHPLGRAVGAGWRRAPNRARKLGLSTWEKTGQLGGPGCEAPAPRHRDSQWRGGQGGETKGLPTPGLPGPPAAHASGRCSQVWS